MNATLHLPPTAEWSALRSWAKTRGLDSLVSLLNSQHDIAVRNPSLGAQLWQSCLSLAAAQANRTAMQ